MPNERYSFELRWRRKSDSAHTPRSLVSMEEMTEMMQMQQVIASILLRDLPKNISESTSSKTYSFNGEMQYCEGTMVVLVDEKSVNCSSCVRRL